MPRHPINLGGGTRWLDLGSYARYGPARRDRLSSAHIAFIARTVRGTPEVMIRMLNQSGRDLGSVAGHLKYLDRDGELAIETDDGEPLKGRGAPAALIDDWDLQLDAKRPPTADHKPRQTAKLPKLVHKMVFSMPAVDAAHEGYGGRQGLRAGGVRGEASVCHGASYR